MNVRALGGSDILLGDKIAASWVISASLSCNVVTGMLQNMPVGFCKEAEEAKVLGTTRDFAPLNSAFRMLVFLVLFEFLFRKRSCFEIESQQFRWRVTSIFKLLLLIERNPPLLTQAEF